MKKTVAFLLTILMLLLFCSCSGQAPASSASSQAAPPAPAKQSFQTKEQKFSDLPRAEAEADEMLAAVSPGGGKWGYIRKDGSYAIEPKFLEAGDFSAGLAAVAVNDREKGILYGYIEPSGEFAEYLRADYTFASGFSQEGIARVRDGESEYFYINRSGTLAFPERILDYGESFYEPFVNAFSFATDFKNGAAVVIDHDPIQNKDHYLLISSEGKILCEFAKKYCEDELFSVASALPDEEGNCIVGIKSGAKTLFGVISKNGGTVLIEPQYEELLPCSQGLFAAKKDGFWGYIDRNGETVQDYAFEEALPFSGDAAPVKYKGKWGILGCDGSWLIEPYFDSVSENGFSEGILAFEKGGKWGYLCEDGTVLTGQTFAFASDFSGGVAFFRNESGFWGLLSVEGAVILEPAFAAVGRFTGEKG